MTAPNLTFEQALPYLRRGLILRAHGHDKYENALVREDQAHLQVSFGDNDWQSTGDAPLFDMNFDIYDQKKSEYVDYTKPLVERDPTAQAVVKGEKDAKEAEGLGPTGAEQPEPKTDEELREDARRILADNGVSEPSNEQVNDFVAQLKSQAAAENPVSETGAGNSPENVSNEGTGTTPGTLGINEAQVQQTRGVNLEHDVRPDVAQESEAGTPDIGVEDGSVQYEGEPVGADNDGDAEHDSHGKKKKRKSGLW